MPVRREGLLNDARPRLENGLNRGLILSAQLVAQRAQRKAPVATGRLKRSITQGRPYSTGLSRQAIDVGTNVEYARIHELGGTIEPMKIVPRFKKALAFDWPNAPADIKPSKDGRYVFKSVMRGEIKIKARPYLGPAIDESRRQVRAIILRSVAGALRG